MVSLRQIDFGEKLSLFHPPQYFHKHWTRWRTSAVLGKRISRASQTSPVFLGIAIKAGGGGVSQGVTPSIFSMMPFSLISASLSFTFS